MQKQKITFLFSVILINTVNASETLTYRLTLKEIGYSTSSGGYAALGFGKEFKNSHLLTGYLGAWEKHDENYFGLNYRYFLNGESTTIDSWFVGANIQSNSFHDGEIQNSTSLLALGGYQWVFNESLSVDLEASLEKNDIGDHFANIGASFSYLF